MKTIFSKKLLIGVCVSVLLTAPSVFASGGGGGHAPASGKSLSPEEAIKAAIHGNTQFTSHHDANYFEVYQKGQTPNITVISCADSRVHTGLFGMDPNNNIFIIRNVGNQVRNSEGSVDYGVRHLPTTILLIMGHSSCGAVKAAMGDYSGETRGIKAELDPLLPVMKHDDHKGPFDIRWAKNVERNVDYQVEYAMELYSDKIHSGDMAVVGGIYDFNNNYGKGRGTLVITNINGEADPNKIIGDHLLKEISKGEVVSHVGSLAPAIK